MMKQHLSVWLLLVRGSLNKLLLILLAMAAVEAALFRAALGQAALRLSDLPAVGSAGLPPQAALSGPEWVFTQSRVVWVFAAAFVLFAVLLCRTGCDAGGRQEYTLRRLALSPHRLLFCQALYNTFCFFLLCWAQLILALALCRWYCSAVSPEAVGSQTVFLAFYRSPFLHGLLPLEEVTLWVRNFFLLPGLGIASACFPVRQRRGERGIAVFLLAAAALLVFPGKVGESGFHSLISILSVTVASLAVAGIWKEPSHEEA